MDMCKIKYTDKQLVKLENLLSKLYILRTCSVDLSEVSQVSEEITQNVEEISQNQGNFLRVLSYGWLRLDLWSKAL